MTQIRKHAIAIGRGSLVRPEIMYIYLDDIYDILDGYKYGVTSRYEDKIGYLIYLGANVSSLVKIIKDFCGAIVYVNGSQILPNDSRAQTVIERVNLPFINSEEDIIEFMFNTSYSIYYCNDNDKFEGAEYDKYDNILSINGDRVIYVGPKLMHFASLREKLA